MFDSLKYFAWETIPGSHVAGKDLLEVGARDYNGSVRSWFDYYVPRSSVGTDMEAGPSVDRVCKAEDLEADIADIIFCFEMLEHAEDWRAAMLGIARALRMQGYLALTTRSPGFPLHDYPGDYNRFTVAQMEAIYTALGFRIIVLESDPEAPGVRSYVQKIGHADSAVLSRITVDSVDPDAAPAEQTTMLRTPGSKVMPAQDEYEPKHSWWYSQSGKTGELLTKIKREIRCALFRS